jgi:hypothetical protein
MVNLLKVDDFILGRLARNAKPLVMYLPVKPPGLDLGQTARPETPRANNTAEPT